MQDVPRGETEPGLEEGHDAGGAVAWIPIALLVAIVIYAALR